MNKHFRLQGEFTTKAPLSHIGEAISTVTYLVEEPILQANRSIESVFCYNGNAWRGQLRDLAATYMLRKLNTTVNIDAFHLLFSGGKIGGDQSIDINQSRTLRRVIPMIGLFGGGVGNQIMPGKMRVNNSYPVCREAVPALPEHLLLDAEGVSYRQLTMEKSYTRIDDSKDDRLAESSINVMDMPLLDGPKSKKADAVSTQMRMTSELLIPGVRLYHEIDFIGVTEVELGVIVSALYAFARSPYIGGQNNRGHGRVDYRSRIVDMDTGEVNDFVRITNATPKLAHVAEQAKQAYDQFLAEQYDQYLGHKNSEIRGLLGAR